MPDETESGTKLENTFRFSGGEIDFTVVHVGDDKAAAHKASDHVMAAMQRPLRGCVDYFHFRTKGATTGTTLREHTATSEMLATSIEMRITVHATTYIEHGLIDLVLAHMCRALVNAGGECMVEAISPEDPDDELLSAQGPGFGIQFGMLPPYGMTGGPSGIDAARHAADDGGSGPYL